MSLVLCVDPGLANIGAVVMDPRSQDGGVTRMVAAYHFHTEKIDRCVKWRHSDDKARRTQEAARFYRDLVQRHEIKRALIELPTGGAPNSAAATDLARAATCVTAVLEVFDVAVEWYEPKECKRALVGNSNASKDQIMAAALERWPALADQFPAKSRLEHVADAAAVWVAGRHGALARL